MHQMIQVLEDTVLYSGKLIDVTSRTLRVHKGGSETQYSIEVARRPPGVRLLVHRNGRYLLLKEYRSELGRWDYRLAGGKVFESQAQHLDFISRGQDLSGALQTAVVNESKEELGIDVHRSQLIRRSSAGATIEWDLYFFEVLSFSNLAAGPQPEATEVLFAEWHDSFGVLTMIRNGAFSEDRSIGVLLQDMLLRGVLQLTLPASAP